MNSSPELWAVTVKWGPFPSNSISSPFCQPGSLAAALVPSCSPAPSLSFGTWAEEAPEQLLAPLPPSQPGLSRELRWAGRAGGRWATGSRLGASLSRSQHIPPSPHLSLQPLDSLLKLSAGCVAQLCRKSEPFPDKMGENT